jgi:uncharacterized membrane protein (UPF0127 family)
MLCCNKAIAHHDVTSMTTVQRFSLVPHRFLASAFRWVRILVGLTATLLGGAALAQEGPQLNLQRTQLSAGMHRIDAQVAATPEQRQIGLMFRKEMPHHEGMLFVFEAPSQQCFWMKNTFLPLTAAFVADDGVIVNLADMTPQSTESHCSSKPVRYVLEMNQGWFDKKGIKAGYRLSGAPFAVKR